MIRSILSFLIVFGLGTGLYPSGNFRIYDTNYKLIMRVERNRLYSKDYKRLGYIENGFVYDKTYKKKGVIENDGRFRSIQKDRKKRWSSLPLSKLRR